MSPICPFLTVTRSSWPSQVHLFVTCSNHQHTFDRVIDYRYVINLAFFMSSISQREISSAAYNRSKADAHLSSRFYSSFPHPNPGFSPRLYRSNWPSSNSILPRTHTHTHTHTHTRSLITAPAGSNIWLADILQSCIKYPNIKLE